MSLIDDALRRAQAAQAPPPGAPGFRVPMPLPDPGLGRRRRMRRLAVSGVAAAAVLAAGILLLRRGTGTGSGAPAPPTLDMRPRPAAAAVSPAPGTPTVAAPASGAVPGRAGARSTASPRTPPPPAGRTASAAASASATPEVPADAAAVRVPATATAGRTIVRSEPPRTPIILPPAEISNASASPRLHAATPGPRREPTPRTFVGTANLPAGKLELGGIVYSESGATALINGRVVSAGSYVEGYTVVSIAPNRVELKDEAGTVVLTLH